MLSWLAVAFLTVWIGVVVFSIATGGERGAPDRAALLGQATAALQDGDGARLHELLLDAPDTGFSDDYASRLRAAGRPEPVPAGPDAVEFRSGQVRTVLSVTEEGGRWYLSLLPPGE
ncbi:hypothetical protein AFB00_29095 [Pseudonocardia sp. HH130630-07]|nr:hypothetical protein AFB00_29095 [Pseudonocardia sp. HH130630-07]